MQPLHIKVGVSITLKELTDIIGVEHNKAMRKVEELAKEPSFGWLAKTATQYQSGKGRVWLTKMLNAEYDLGVTK